MKNYINKSAEKKVKKFSNYLEYKKTTWLNINSCTFFLVVNILSEIFAHILAKDLE